MLAFNDLPYGSLNKCFQYFKEQWDQGRWNVSQAEALVRLAGVLNMGKLCVKMSSYIKAHPIEQNPPENSTF